MSLAPKTDAAQLLPEELEARLRDLVAEVSWPASPPGPGRPPQLPALVLWAGLLVCVLRGWAAQRSLWQLVTFVGFWHFPRVEITEQAVNKRLERTPPTALLSFFTALTQLLRQRYAGVNDVPQARFATEILALDHSTLDAVCRKLKVFRDLPRGAPALLPGQLATLFDVRRQLFAQVEFWEDARQNEKFQVEHWLERLLPGTLLLFDLGFFSFAWFDRLTEHQCYFLSRCRQKTTYVLHQVLYAGQAGPIYLRDQLVYLGRYRADRAKYPVRWIELVHPTGTYRYLTNVLDPAQLSAADVLELYRRRWDLEQAFHLLKSHLHLCWFWSGHPYAVQHQVFATLSLAQVVLGLRLEVAQQAQAALREVSLPLLLRWLPRLAAQGGDPVRLLAERGRRAKIIRPRRGKTYLLPAVALSEYTLPAEWPPPRQSRSAGRTGQAGRRPSAAALAQQKEKWKQQGTRRTSARRSARSRVT